MKEPIAKSAKKSALEMRAAKIEAARERDEQSVDLGPWQGRLPYYLRRLQRDFKTHFGASIGDLGVQARDVGALFAIGLNPGLTPSQLASAALLNAAQVTSMINEFALRGWTERRVSTLDARSRTLHLTPIGKKLLAKLEPMIDAIDQEFVEGILTEQEESQLIGLLAKLLVGRQQRSRT